MRPLPPSAALRRSVVRAACVPALCALIACAPGEPPSPADAFRADPAALTRGQQLFNGVCAGYCHGLSPGPRDAPYLFDCTWLHGGRDADLFQTVSEGVPNTQMIAYGGVLPEGDDDIWRLVAYIKSAGPENC